MASEIMVHLHVKLEDAHTQAVELGFCSAELRQQLFHLLPENEVNIPSAI